MNEKIKELAEQAGLRFTQLMSNPMVPVVDGKETDLEKFAELIVAKMLQTCEDHPAWTGRMIGEEIKQRFGVEE